jgi:glucosyl-dolichyl phosphate glucuronosyltransferase
MSSDLTPGVSLLVCTYNRQSDLAELLESALSQDTGGTFHYEVLVVDNNSRDNTRETVTGLLSRHHGRLRYFFEPRQGKSFALNLALSECRTDICAIGDDDLVLPPGYVANVWRLFNDNSHISLVGGKVLPQWRVPPPEWLTASYWSALALCDFGEEPIETSISRPICLMAAAFRRQDLLASGEYAEDLAVKDKQIGGVEDAEIYLRMYRAGRRGLYHPALHLYHKVEPDRLTRAYHRRWHTGHGRYRARFREAEFERSRFRFLGIPAHMIRTVTEDLGKCIRGWLSANPDAFLAELRVRFFGGFAAQRIQDTFFPGAKENY